MRLNEKQEEGVELILKAPVGVITGGPGTGKTTILKEAVRRMAKDRGNYALLAPTGKAARRMSEVTATEASTIHRALRGFEEHCPSTIIIDEASMVDTALLAQLLRAVRPTTRLFFIGDVNQLPSIGPGVVFDDMITSGVVPVVRLEQVHRSGPGSWVCNHAPGILHGEFNFDTTTDFEFIDARDEDEAQQHVLRLAAEHDKSDAQVLVPMHRGGLGTKELNRALQRARIEREKVTSEGIAIKAGKSPVSLFNGDPVMQMMNNYKRMVFNGESGVVVDTGTYGSKRPGLVTVNFDSGPQYYGYGELEENLQLSYAITIHKCVAPDTLVETEEGLLPISSIVGVGTIATADGPRHYDTKVVNPDTKMLSLETHGGYRLDVTPEHGLLVWGGDAWTRVNACDAKPGMFVRMKLGSTVEPVGLVSLPAYCGTLNVRAVMHRTPGVLTRDFAEFLGLMVADGTLFETGFRLAKRHLDVADRFAALCNHLFGVTPKRRSTETCHYVEVSSKHLAAWLSQVGGMGPRNKAVPLAILQSPLEVQASFLSGLFEDGTVNVRGGQVDHIAFTTCQEALARTVQTMLLRFRIVSSRKKVKAQHALYIYGAFAQTFGERIGFVSAFKQGRLSRGVYARPVRYLIPVAPTRLPGLSSAAQNSRARGTVSRATAEDLGLHEDLAFHYERIESISEYVGPSVCVRVPDGGRFLQNGMDHFNSQGSEYRTVILVCHDDHDRMWTRQLLYTAVTRAKERVFIVGTRSAVRHALSIDQPASRLTTLRERILEQEQEEE